MKNKDKDIPIMRFKTGSTYRLRTSQDSQRYLGGTMTVRAELKPTDIWGNRILLGDFTLTDSSGTPLQDGIRLGARVFVEEGITEVQSPEGTEAVRVEIAALQGCYPNFAKAYATDELIAEQTARDSSTAA